MNVLKRYFLLILCLTLESGSSSSRRRERAKKNSEAINKEDNNRCDFPEEWWGSWFLGGSRDSFQIKKQQFGLGSWCYLEHQSHVFTVLKRPEKCFQCVQVWARHENVLQYKVGDCVKKKNNNRHLKCNFPENLPMETLLKLNGTNTPCPFSGAYNFTYKKDGKECNSPSSEIVKCMNPSQSLFKFEVCPDDVEEDAGGNVFYNTIIGLDGDSQETLTCKATWDNDLNDKETYMMGTFDYRYKRTDQERVRCFLVQETKRGIQIAQSSDGTCYNNLRSSQSGYRTMKLDKVEDPNEDSDMVSCTFPNWAVDMGPLLSFSFTSKYEFLNSGEVLSVSNYSTVSRRGHELSRTSCLEIEEENDTMNYVKMVTKVSAGCDQMFKCMRIFKRTENILEIQEGSPTNFRLAACSPQNFDEKLMIYTTLIKENLEPQPCPINGIHNVSHLNLDGQMDVCTGPGFSKISLTCDKENYGEFNPYPTIVEFYKECPSEDPKKHGAREISSSAKYQCLGGWSENVSLSDLPDPKNQFLNQFFSLGGMGNGRRRNMYTTNDDQESTKKSPNVTIGYVVAMRSTDKNDRKEDQKRICFIYMKDTNLNQRGSQYSWTVDKTACLRNIRPGFGARLVFNTTVLETCGAGRRQTVIMIVLGALSSHLLLRFQAIL